MRVNSDKPVTGPERAPEVGAKSADAAEASRPKVDRVSVQQREVLRVVEDARAGAGGARTARLREIEASVRAGTYRPNPSQVAEEILAAAELDARIRAIFSK